MLCLLVLVGVHCESHLNLVRIILSFTLMTGSHWRLLFGDVLVYFFWLSYAYMLEIVLLNMNDLTVLL